MTSEHCYEQLGSPTGPPAAFAYLKLFSVAELAVAFGDGDCPEQLPAEHHAHYR